MKIQVEMWKCETKVENAKRNMTMWVEMWKHESKCEKVSWNVKMQIESTNVCM